MIGVQNLLIQNRLLTTKFHIPFWRENGVPRPQLLAHLNNGITQHQKLTLISAPAGYGKTVLAAEWIQELNNAKNPENCVAWLSLDEGDNDPARFLTYLVAAVQRKNEDLGQSTQSLLGMPQIPALTTIIDEFINELATLDDKIFFVLDDYHVIHNLKIHEMLEYLIENQPAQFHIVITTREDPALPLARYRVRAWISEIRAHDLRFNTQESLHFFNTSMGLNLDENSIRKLETRTEGWVAGLQLAALAMQNLPDQPGFVNNFSGSHRYIIDYLVDEVLKSLPEEINTFLSETCILKRFNAGVCHAVTGNAGSAEILAQLDSSNLFLIALDDQRGWYRYHQLFADVLQTSLTSEKERDIHLRAALWFEANGLLAEAIDNCLAAVEMDEAARLITIVAEDLLRNGEIQTLLGWINKLPEEQILANADLASTKALALLLTGKTAMAAEYAADIFSKSGQQTANNAHGRLLAIEAWMANTSGDARTGELASAAIAQLDDQDLFFKAFSLIALGSSLAWESKLKRSSEIFREAWQIGRRLDHPFLTLGALANLAFNLLEIGSLQEAEGLCRAAVEQFVDKRGKPLPILGILYSALASICFEKGEFSEAEEFANLGSSLSRRLFSNTIAGADSEIVLARIYFYRGDFEQAYEILQTTAESARQFNIMMVVFKMNLVKADFLLLQAKIAQAEVLIEVLDGFVQTSLPKAAFLVAHLHARLLILKGHPDQALEILANIEKEIKTGESKRKLVGILLTRSLACQKQGDHPAAEKTFTEAIHLASPEGYRSIFTPFEGKPTKQLLRSALSSAPELVDSILKEESGPESILQEMPDPLSEQELKILKLIVLGHSNRKISEELFITVGTAKWHVHNIYQKLGVNNRPEAIARALELNLN